MHGGDEKCINNFIRKERDHCGDLGIGRRIILKCTIKE
jgi:hypothetical protein